VTNAETSPDHLETATAIRHGAIRLARRLRSSRSAGALSTNKISVLSHLMRYGPSTPGEVAAVDRQQPQSLTRVFADLERDGLIVRTISKRDRRVRIPRATPAGVEIVTKVAIARDTAINDRLAAIPPSERASFHATLWNIVESTAPEK